MDLRSALKRQYRGALAMLRKAISDCPPAVWNSGPAGVPYWRVVYHTLYFTHLYLGRDLESFRPWERHRDEYHDLPWPSGSGPELPEPYSQADLLEYWDFCNALVNTAIDAMNLEADDCGIPWHRGMPKLDHQLHNIRHIQHHAAFLAARLRDAGGPEFEWVRQA